MNEKFRRRNKMKIDDIIQQGNVNATSGYISNNKNFHFSIPKSFQIHCSRFLIHTAIDLLLCNYLYIQMIENIIQLLYYRSVIENIKMINKITRIRYDIIIIKK